MVITSKEYFQLNLTQIRIFFLIFLTLIFFILFCLSFYLLNKEFKFLFLILLLINLLGYLIFFSLGTLLFNQITFLFFLVFLNFIIFVLFYSFFHQINLTFIIYFILFYNLTTIFVGFLNKKLLMNELKIPWMRIFQTSWHWHIIFFLFMSFLYFYYFFNLTNFRSENLMRFLDRTNYFFEILNIGITPNTTISQIIKKNMPSLLEMDQTLEEQTIKITVEEINNKFKLNLTPQSTVKEAIAQYLEKNLRNLYTPHNKTLRFLVFILLLLVINSILQMLGYLLSFLVLPIFFLLKTLKLYYIKEESTYQEILAI